MSIPEQIKDKVQSEVRKISGNQNHSEGRLTTMVESQTAKVPSISWLGLAVGSMAISAGLEIFSKKKEYGNFVGLWAPCFLLMGIYNKLVKLEGSDQQNPRAAIR